MAFYSQAPNLVTGQVDNNSSQDVFLYTRATGAERLRPSPEHPGRPSALPSHATARTSLRTATDSSG